MKKSEAKSRIEKLKREINYHRYLYHVLDRQEISDEALDSLKHELAELETKFPDLITPDSPTRRVGGKAIEGFQKVRHATPMLSLNDAFSEAELGAWEARIKKLLGSRDSIDYFAELKVDGLAISLIYKNGIFETGATRGDGAVGENVTENLKTVESIPLRLHDVSEFEKEKKVRRILDEFPRVKRALSRLPERLEIRGEVYMTKRAFDALNRSQQKRGMPIYANPRNVASGSIRQLDPKIAASRSLAFHAYDLVTDLGQATHEEEHLIASLLGFKTVEFTRRCATLSDVIAFWKEIAAKRESLPYIIDGVVVQVNQNALFQKLGIIGKAPRGAIAFKFAPKQATTIVENIILQVGRTGVLTPVALLKPVTIGGATISRATLHNFDEIKRLDIRVGDTVIVERAGDVIPDIVRVLENLRPRGAKSFEMPKIFCGQKVLRPAGEVQHRILHPERCMAARRRELRHFVSKNAFDIVGVGPKILDRLVERGIIETPADLFRIKETDLLGLPGFQETLAQKLIRSIQSKKEIALSRFIFALGIRHVGEQTAFDLANHFGTLKRLEGASRDEITALPNIGPVVGESVWSWFRDSGHKALLNDLIRAGVTVTHAPKPHVSKLSGKSFVITGTLKNISRDEAKTIIRNRGGTVSESVSKKTDYLVVGAEPGSKLEKAKKLGVPIIDETQFERLLTQ